MSTRLILLGDINVAGTWLRHLAQMDNYRISKQLFFAELIKTRSRHGPKKQWRDLAVMDDLRTLGIEEDCKRWAQQFVYRSVYLLMLGRFVLLTGPL